MTHDAPSQDRSFLPPTGGKLLHALIDAFRLRERDQQPPPFSRSHLANVLHGDPLAHTDRATDSYRATVYSWVAKSLLRSGLLPATPSDPGEGPAAEVALTDAIAHLVGVTDGVRALLVPHARHLTDSLIALQPVLHVAAVDLGLRLGGLFTWFGLPMPMSTQRWARPDGAGWFLRHWSSRGVQSPLRQTDLRKELDDIGDPDLSIDPPSLSKWFAGKERPSPANTRKLAQALANRCGQSADSVHRALECHDALCAIARDVAMALADGGATEHAWQVVGDAASLGLDALRGAMSWLATTPMPAAERRVLAHMLFARGTDQQLPCFRDLVPHIVKPIASPTLRAYALHAFGDLDDFVAKVVTSAQDLPWHAARMASGHEAGAGDPRDALRRSVCDARDALLAGSVPTFRPPAAGSDADSAPEDGLAGARAALVADALQARGEREAALDYWQQAVAASPDQARYHYRLGALLGRMRRRDDALHALRRAIELRPDWTMPRGEIGVVLLNSGMAAAAEAELRLHLAALGQRDPWLLELLGGALAQQARWTEAVSCFEESLRLRPDDPETLHHAADASFRAGDRRRGLELAKKAADLGRPATLANHKAGVYLARHAAGQPRREEP